MIDDLTSIIAASQKPANAGIVFDIVGALFLARALAFNSDVSIQLQSGTYWTENPNLVQALVEQRYDARAGLFVLVAGFALQFYGNAFGEARNGLWLLAALVIVASTLQLAKKHVVKIRTRELLSNAADGAVVASPNDLNLDGGSY